MTAHKRNIRNRGDYAAHIAAKARRAKRRHATRIARERRAIVRDS